MKRLFMFLVITLGLFLIGPLSAQTADEVINKYFDAIGGKQNWRALNNTYSNVEISQMGLELNGEVFAQTPNLGYTSIEIYGKKIIQAFDGENAWTVNPMMGSTEPTLLEGPEAEQLRNQKFQDELLDYSAKGHTTSYLGEKESQGTLCHLVLLTKNNGDEITFFFDSETGIKLVESVKITDGDQAGKLLEVHYADYSEVEGLLFPFSVSQRIDGQVLMEMNIISMDVNVDFDKSKYIYPGN